MRFASTASRQENGREFLRQPEAPASYRAGADVLLRHAPDPQIICGFPLGPGPVRGPFSPQPLAAPSPFPGPYHNTGYGRDGDRGLSRGRSGEGAERGDGSPRRGGR